MQSTRGQLAFALVVLFGINTMNFYDRQILGAVGEDIREQWHLDDRDLSGLTIAFILLYAAIGLPLGHWADVGRRRMILAIGVILWSVMTALSGLARDFAMLFVFRLGVGLGEASCAPAANSLLGDLFPAQQRGRALAVFMFGLPLGLGLSYLISGIIAETWSWRVAFFVACGPGLVLGVLALWLPEPERGATEKMPRAGRAVAGIDSGTKTGSDSLIRDPQSAIRSSSTMVAVLSIPTMWWIILSGALLNLNMYALGSFLTSFLKRYHGLGTADANIINGLIYGFGGIGILGGGWLGDRLAKRRVRGRLELVTLAMAIAAPCLWFALQFPRGQTLGFALWLLPGCLCLYVYYSAVYASIQDIVAPSQRGTAMALYFFVFYLFTAVGLYGFAWLSDHLAARYRSAGASDADARAFGLLDAMYSLPVITVLLVVVLFIGSRTVTRDHERLQRSLV
jgi:MFS family permease